MRHPGNRERKVARADRTYTQVKKVFGTRIVLCIRIYSKNLNADLAPDQPLTDYGSNAVQIRAQGRGKKPFF